jgi:hypothetical protein
VSQPRVHKHPPCLHPFSSCAMVEEPSALFDPHVLGAMLFTNATMGINRSAGLIF